MSCPFEVLFNPEFAEKKQRKCLKEVERGWKEVNISVIKAKKVFERGENLSI